MFYFITQTTTMASSYTLSLSGNTSMITADYFPPLVLTGCYECGLVELQTFNSIPNIDHTNNKLHYGNNGDYVELPTGSYEIDDISKAIQDLINEKSKALAISDNDVTKTLDDDTISKKMFISIVPNNNTLKCSLKSTKIVHFDKNDSIGSVLGFTKRKLAPGLKHESDVPVNILKVNSVRIECNIISNSYINNERVHTIHEFFPNVPPGYKIIELPNTIIYLPVTVPSIDNITIKIVDQNGNLVNFRGENISIRLHLKSC